MPQSLPVLFHVLIGSAGIVFFWVALLAVKGSPRHRRWGKAFFATLIVVALSVAPLILMRPGPFDPAWAIQFVYLALCLVTVTTIGWTAIRWKNDLARFRGIHFKILGPVILLLGGVVLAAGLASASLLTVSFSWVGMVYGASMMRFAWMRAAPHPRWSTIWHLNAVCGLFNAVHGNVLAVLWRFTIDPAAGDDLGAATQILTVLTALALRLAYGARYNAPMRLAAPSLGSTQPA